MHYLFIGTFLMATGIVIFAKGPWSQHDATKIPPPNPVPPLWSVAGPDDPESEGEDSDPEKKRSRIPFGPQSAVMISVPPR